MAKSAEPDRAVLQRIADALGMPIERFFEGGLPISADECLYLWSRIKTEEGQRQALDALQMIADQEGQ